MTNLMRYSVVLDPHGGDPMEPDVEGTWVRYDDIKHLLQDEPSVAPIGSKREGTEPAGDSVTDDTAAFQRAVNR